MLEIDVLLTEEKLAQDFLCGLERRYLPEKFFYWFPLSVRAWLELCQANQPYQNFSRSYRLVSRYAADVASRCSPPRTEVVGLGAGQGDKDLLVLQALRSNRRAPCYRPVDSSQALLEMALARAHRAGCQGRGLKADLEDPETSKFVASSADRPRLYLLLGNSLGVIDPFQFLKTLRGLLHKQDLLLLDGEIYSPQLTLQGYDNAANRRFAFAPLASLGLEEGRDGNLVFGSKTDPRLEGLHLVSKHFRATRRLDISPAGQAIGLEAGEEIAMNSSWKYSSTAFRKMVEETGGFQLLREYVSEDGRFLMALVAPARSERRAVPRRGPRRRSRGARRGNP